MKTIVVPTDFSRVALNAARYACKMAAALNAEVNLLHVYSLPVSYSEITTPYHVQEIRRDALQDLKELKGLLASETGTGIKISYNAVLGDLLPELQHYCKKHYPYVVVIGSQGKTAAERLLFGSNALRIVRRLNWPVIAVPPGASFEGLLKIGIACDMINVGETVPFGEIKSLLRNFRSELHILNTGRSDQFDADIVIQSAILEEKLKGVKVNFHFLTSPDTDDAIVEFAQNHDIDLLMILPKHHSAIEKLIHRSHSKQLVLHSHVPVMALHA